MKRTTKSMIPSLAMLLAAGTLAAQAPAGRGNPQGQAAAPADVQVTANKLAADFYALQGNGLSTVGVLVGTDGVLMVDGGTSAIAEKVAAAVKTLSDRPIRFLINTHQHPDHTGGNELFAKGGTAIVSRDELRARLAATTGRGAVPPAALPLLTYRGRDDVQHEWRRRSIDSGAGCPH